MGNCELDPSKPFLTRRWQKCAEEENDHNRNKKNESNMAVVVMPERLVQDDKPKFSE